MQLNSLSTKREPGLFAPFFCLEKVTNALVLITIEEGEHLGGRSLLI